MAEVAAPTEEGQAWLLAEARGALYEAMGQPRPTGPPRPDDVALDERTRMFVSWHLGPRLVGCIGTLAPTWTLTEGVTAFAVKSGLHDRRTPNPTIAELPELRCDISILGPPTPLCDDTGARARGFEAVVANLVPHRHGVTLTHPDGRSAYFLPVVWKQLPEAPAFVRALCRKAGIDPGREGDAITVEVNAVVAFSEAS